MERKVMKKEYDSICHIGNDQKVPLWSIQKVTFDFELNLESQLYINTHTVLWLIIFNLDTLINRLINYILWIGDWAQSPIPNINHN